MASLLIKGDSLSVGDVLCLPFNKTATVEKIKPFGPKAVYVNFKTEFGWTRIERTQEVFVEAKTL